MVRSEAASRSEASSPWSLPPLAVGLAVVSVPIGTVLAVSPGSFEGEHLVAAVASVMAACGVMILVQARTLALGEETFGRVPLRQVTAGWFLALPMRQGLYRRCAKRGLDFLLAALGLVCAVPILLLIAVVVRRSGPGPVLLRQARIGAHGKVFSMVKFRTMIDTGEAAGKPSWAGENDERVTRVGRTLRRTHLDELPQLWNVLVGDMSLVGPRPERPELDALLEQRIPFWSRRHAVKPGVTGWAQIRQGYASSVDASRVKLSYDLYYLEHCSPSLDFLILARTFWDVVRAVLVA